MWQYFDNILFLKRISYVGEFLLYPLRYIKHVLELKHKEISRAIIE